MNAKQKTAVWITGLGLVASTFAVPWYAPEKDVWEPAVAVDGSTVGLHSGHNAYTAVDPIWEWPRYWGTDRKINVTLFGGELIAILLFGRFLYWLATPSPTAPK